MEWTVSAVGKPGSWSEREGVSDQPQFQLLAESLRFSAFSVRIFRLGAVNTTPDDVYARPRVDKGRACSLCH
ncbi:hypothetical protein O3P69_004108 [Scylla paramamosain]|uniref:Uncharacterized protein n=1 Tax=Scylla paramamosain TaxID=85552 RepID=A0AAW0UII9_SCYPA